MGMQAEKICGIMVSAEREAAELVMHAKAIMAESKTGHRDVVTEYDRRVQAQLMEALRREVPGAAFVGEENDQMDDLNAEHLFIIDPIDGTMNFVRHFNHSCISIAYLSCGELMAAAVYNPFVDEMFTAVTGKGAFLNGKPIHVSADALSESVVCCGTSPYVSELTDKSFDLMKKVFKRSLDLRRQGSAELDLCSVAAGRAGAYFEYQVSLWDYAAGALIVSEAGGKCTMLDGSPLPFDGTKPTILAGGALAAAEILAIAKGE